MNSSTVAAFVSMMHSISTFPAASLTAIEMLAWCTSMPIYFLLSIWVLLSVGSEPTPPAYAERGALFYNALTGERGIVVDRTHSGGCDGPLCAGWMGEEGAGGVRPVERGQDRSREELRGRDGGIDHSHGAEAGAGEAGERFAGQGAAGGAGGGALCTGQGPACGALCRTGAAAVPVFDQRLQGTALAGSCRCRDLGPDRTDASGSAG